MGGVRKEKSFLGHFDIKERMSLMKQSERLYEELPKAMAARGNLDNPFQKKVDNLETQIEIIEEKLRSI